MVSALSTESRLVHAGKRVSVGELILVGMCFMGVIGLLVGRSCRSFLFYDDFLNIENALRLDVWRFLRSSLLIEPFRRPVGHAVYAVLYHFFELNGSAYHMAMLMLHGINCLQVYLLTRMLSGSRCIALAAGLVHTYQFSNMVIYLEFGTIFDVLAAFWYWRALIWYVESRNSLSVGGGWQRITSLTAFWLALGSKEMAVTLPVVLTWYAVVWDSSWRRDDLRQSWARRTFGEQWIYYLFLVVFLVVFWTRHAAPVPGVHTDQLAYIVRPPAWTVGMSSYEFQLTAQAWYDGTMGYLQKWFCDRIPSITIGCLATAVLLLAIRWRDRLLFFALGYIVLTFLPVVFLVHPKSEFFWYLPQLGMAMIIGGLVQRVRAWSATLGVGRHAIARLLVTGALLTGTISAAVLAPGRLRRDVEVWYLALSDEYRAFVYQLRDLYPQMPAHTLIVWRRGPRFLTSEALAWCLHTVYGDRSLRVVLLEGERTDALERSVSADAIVLDYQDGRIVQVGR